ncbi:MAG: hypothetical protein ACWA5R_03545 [bacterium]
MKLPRFLFIVISITFIIINNAYAESFGSRREMIDITTQPNEQIQAAPNTDRTIKVSPSGLTIKITSSGLLSSLQKKPKSSYKILTNNAKASLT